MESVNQFETQDEDDGTIKSSNHYDIQAYKEYYDNYGDSIRGENQAYDSNYQTNATQNGLGQEIKYMKKGSAYDLKDIDYDRNRFSEVASLQASEKF